MRDQLLQSNTIDVPPTEGAPTDRNGAFERDIAYSLLSSRRRRNVLHALYEADGESTVADLARQLAAWETDQTPATISSKERKRSYTALRQTHLPKLAKHGLVDYDANRGTVRLTDAGREFRPYLRSPIEHGTPLRLALTAVCSVTVVALLSWLGIAPFALLGGYQLVGVVTLAFGIVTLGTYVRYRPARLDRQAKTRDTAYDSSDD